MRALASLSMLLLAGCSLVLGIEDPKSHSDGGNPPPDVMTISTDVLKFSLTDFTFAQGQTVRLHVMLIHKDGMMGDVTQQAIYTSDNETFATIGGKGLINGGSQAGAATITASLGDAMPATLKATTTAVVCHPVINELLVGTAASASDEFVEIYNPCTTTISVDNWTLDYRAVGTIGTTDATLLSTLSGQMASGEFRLYAGTAYSGLGVHDGTFTMNTGLAAAGGAVGLRAGPKDTGALVDSMAYGAVSPANPFIETNPIATLTDGKTASRKLFDGKDTNDNAADFAVPTTPTPRAQNVP